MSTFDVFEPGNAGVKSPVFADGKILAPMRGIITDISDNPKEGGRGLGRVKVSIVGLSREPQPLDVGRDGWIPVGELSTSPRSPSGTHRDLAVGGQVIVMFVNGDPTDAVVTFCENSDKALPPAGTDRAQRKTGMVTPGGVHDIRDDVTHSHYVEYPHGVRQVVDGTDGNEDKSGAGKRGSVKTETAGGASQYLSPKGDVFTQSPSAFQKLTQDGELSQGNSAGAIQSLLADGLIKIATPFGSAISLETASSLINGPKGSLFSAASTVFRDFGGALEASRGFAEAAKRVLASYDAGSMTPEATANVLIKLLPDELADQVGLGFKTGKRAVGAMRFAADKDTLDILAKTERQIIRDSKIDSSDYESEDDKQTAFIPQLSKYIDIVNKTFAGQISLDTLTLEEKAKIGERRNHAYAGAMLLAVAAPLAKQIELPEEVVREVLARFAQIPTRETQKIEGVDATLSKVAGLDFKSVEEADDDLLFQGWTNRKQLDVPYVTFSVSSLLAELNVVRASFTAEKLGIPVAEVIESSRQGLDPGGLSQIIPNLITAQFLPFTLAERASVFPSPDLLGRINQEVAGTQRTFELQVRTAADIVIPSVSQVTSAHRDMGLDSAFELARKWLTKELRTVANGSLDNILEDDIIGLDTSLKLVLPRSIPWEAEDTKELAQNVLDRTDENGLIIDKDLDPRDWLSSRIRLLAINSTFESVKVFSRIDEVFDGFHQTMNGIRDLSAESVLEGIEKVRAALFKPEEDEEEEVITTTKKTKAEIKASNIKKKKNWKKRLASIELKFNTPDEYRAVSNLATLLTLPFPKYDAATALLDRSKAIALLLGGEELIDVAKEMLTRLQDVEIEIGEALRFAYALAKGEDLNSILPPPLETQSSSIKTVTPDKKYTPEAIAGDKADEKTGYKLPEEIEADAAKEDKAASNTADKTDDKAGDKAVSQEVLDEALAKASFSPGKALDEYLQDQPVPTGEDYRRVSSISSMVLLPFGTLDMEGDPFALAYTESIKEEEEAGAAADAAATDAATSTPEEAGGDSPDKAAIDKAAADKPTKEIAANNSVPTATLEEALAADVDQGDAVTGGQEEDEPPAEDEIVKFSIPAEAIKMRAQAMVRMRPEGSDDWYTLEKAIDFIKFTYESASDGTTLTASQIFRSYVHFEENKGSVALLRKVMTPPKKAKPNKSWIPSLPPELATKDPLSGMDLSEILGSPDRLIAGLKNIIEILRSVIGQILKFAQGILEKIANLENIMPVGSAGAVVDLGKSSGKMMAGGFPGAKSAISKGFGGGVEVTLPESRLFAPGGAASVFAKAGSVGMSFGGSSLFGLSKAGGSMLSSARMAMRVSSKVKDLSSGLVLDPQGGASIASFVSKIPANYDIESDDEGDWNEAWSKPVGEVSVTPDGKVLIRSNTGSGGKGSVFVNSDDVRIDGDLYINNRRFDPDQMLREIESLRSELASMKTAASTPTAP